MRKLKTLDFFIEGKCLLKVNNVEDVNNIYDRLLEEDCEAMVRISDSYMSDFGKNKNSKAYYLFYYKKQHALKAMDNAFFEQMYPAGIRVPHVFEI